MTHDAAVKAIDGAIYRAEENLQDAHNRATGARANANQAKTAWEEQQQEAERCQRVAAEYRAELEQLRISKRALTSAGGE